MQIQKTDKIDIPEIVPPCDKNKIVMVYGGTHFVIDGYGQMHPTYSCAKCHKWHIGD